ncbi:MAG: protoporphyrinogen oxidase [Candidatus Eremiobacteraeota bacterium]|nr:protoporphyrinogen oxidase [Candidatus Eremiobacteraeota bacterium]
MSGAFESVDVAVVGGGISGLTAAYALRKAGRNAVLLEASQGFGGCMGSVRAQPYLADRGPQSFVATPPLVELIHDLGLDEQVIAAGASGARRYIYRHGALIPVPMSPGALVGTPLLSLSAKLRLAGEFFVRNRPTSDDESVASFLARRAGGEIVEAVAGPVIAGIYAGDPARLSARSTLPGMVRFEETHGSVIRGFLSQPKATVATRRQPSRTIGFRGGNAQLIDALTAALQGSAYAGARVARIRQRGAGFALECDGLPEGTIEAARVIVATPAAGAADLLEALEPAAAAALREIEYAPIAQIVSAYPRGDIGVPIDGFGFLACRGEGVRILGAVWNSAIFTGRSPDDELLCTAFLGGALDAEIGALSDTELAQVAHTDLSRVMHIAPGTPKVVAGFRWAAAIPQYTIGHAQRVARIDAAAARVPGLFLIGNYADGVSVADCVRRARDAAARAAR